MHFVQFRPNFVQALKSGPDEMDEIPLRGNFVRHFVPGGRPCCFCISSSFVRISSTLTGRGEDAVVWVNKDTPEVVVCPLDYSHRALDQVLGKPAGNSVVNLEAGWK